MLDRKKHQRLFKKINFYKLFAEEAEDKTRAQTDLEGIKLTYHNIPKDLQTKIWVNRDFEKAIALVTLGDLRLEKVVNTYTVGNYTKYNHEGLAGVNNFYDPLPRFKDSWFDVCFIFDGTKARRFMLKDPKGDPSDLNNINPLAVVKIAGADQMLIYSTTLKGLGPGMWIDKICEMHFNQIDKLELARVHDNSGNEWIQLSRLFQTHAALTDISKTKMDLEKSINVLVGMPTQEVYEYLDPWHPITFRGVGCIRFFNFGEVKFWPVVYYNASRFIDKTGRKVDNWTAAKDDLTLMFKTLKIEPLK